MKFPFHPWRRLLLCALPFAALLTACDDGKKEPPPKPAEVTTYNSVPWDALPATSDADLLAGFNAWRSACARLAKDPVWASPVRAPRRSPPIRRRCARSSRSGCRSIACVPPATATRA